VIRVTRNDEQMYKRRVMEVYQRYVQRRVNGLYRVADGRELLRKYEEMVAAGKT